MGSISRLVAITSLLLLAAPARADVTLGFALGNTQGPGAFVMDPTTLVPPNNSIHPQTTYGLNDWSLGTPISAGGSAGNPLVLNPGEKLILQIQMVDSGTYTFPNTPGGRMFQWGARLTYSPGVISATRDPNATDGVATTVTVNSGNGTSEANINYANLNHHANSFGIGNIFFSGFITDNSPGPRYYALANFVLNVEGPGDAILSLSDMNTNQVNWSNMGGVTFDSQVFGSGGSGSSGGGGSGGGFAMFPSLYLHVNPVPEPCSIAMMGVAVGCFAARRLRKKN